VTPEKKRLRVGVLFERAPGEHEVSLASAASVIPGPTGQLQPCPIGIPRTAILVGGRLRQKSAGHPEGGRA